MGRTSSYQTQYRKHRRQGKADLRFLSLLLFLALLLYTALSFYLISRISNADQELYMRFCFSVLGTLLMWSIVLRLLWKFNRLGRLLYWLGLFFSAYLYKDAVILFSLTWEPAVDRYAFILLFLLKCIILLYGGLRLSFSPAIRSIWSMNELFDRELAALEPAQEQPQSIPLSPSDQKIITLLKRSSITLALCLYLSMIAIFVLLGLMSSQLPDYSEGLHAIQYQLFSECLFSALLWSVPIIIMYMGRKWSPYLIYVGGGGEFIRLGLSYVTYMQLFQNAFIPTAVKVLFVLIDCIRYLTLYLLCRSLLHHPLIKKLRLTHGENENNE